jgi:hypothetical protein
MLFIAIIIIITVFILLIIFVFSLIPILNGVLFPLFFFLFLVLSGFVALFLPFRE